MACGFRSAAGGSTKQTLEDQQNQSRQVKRECVGVRKSSLRFFIETDADGEEDWAAIQPGGSFLGSSRALVLVITYVP